MEALEAKLSFKSPTHQEKGGTTWDSMRQGSACFSSSRELAIINTAIALIEGFYFIFGGDRGRWKAIRLINIMGAFTLADMVDQNIKF